MPIARQVTMAKQVTESPQTSSACEQEVVFRSVTPVIHYKIEGDATFPHSGRYKGGRLQVELSPWTPSQAAVDLLRYALAVVRVDEIGFGVGEDGGSWALVGRSSEPPGHAGSALGPPQFSQPFTEALH